MTRFCQRRRSFMLAMAAGLQLMSAAPWAACALSTSGIAFGGYDPLLNQHVDSVANVNVTCDETTAYTIALSTGSGTYETRMMSSGLQHLLYNLYVDAALTTVWGDGTGQSATVSDNRLVGNHTVYGRIPAGQNPHVGVYGDTIVITLTF